jgi:hypothetical protein
MGVYRATRVQNAISNIINQKFSGDYYSIIKFDNHTEIEVPATQNNLELKSNFQQNGLKNFGAKSAISDGILGGIKSLTKVPNDIPRYVVIYTDGYDNNSIYPKDSVIKLALQNNVNICTIDFGDSIKSGFMLNYAKATSGSYNHIYGTSEFDKVFNDIVLRLKTYYLIEYKPQEFGLHKITIKYCFNHKIVFDTISFNNMPEIGTINILPLVFENDKSNINKQNEEILDNLVNLFKSNINMEMEFRAFTENQNHSVDVDYNTRLSQKRVDSIKNYLVKNGISANKIITKGYGEKMPISNNSNESGKTQNQRVEFIILKK